MIGTNIAHYQITEKIGQGGMGEVYRATDTKLNRDVALKILPEEFAADSQRMGRFQREAEVLASLSHNNIGHIYGIEDAGKTKALVLQLVEGPTLADRIAQGPIPVEEALKIALQIAEGLEAAHEKGVIHRDLKPANIKITPEGQVKILDFGLAKAMEGDPASPDMSQSPTLSMQATQAGVILGTAAYMSPEQARGKPIDQRTDIWAFGAVVFETLSGKRAFEGEDVSETLASILKSEPDWEALPQNTPSNIRTLLRRCLQRELENRFHHAADVRIETSAGLSEPTIGHESVVAEAGRFSRRMLVGLGFASFLLGAAVTSLLLFRPSPSRSEEATALRLQLVLPEDQQFTLTSGLNPLAISPDGNHLVYDANNQLYLRRMDEFEARPIRGTEGGGRSPFFSSDSEWIGFWLNGQLKKVGINGGTPFTLCVAEMPAGVFWGQDTTIIYSQGRKGIWQVSENGGTPELLVGIEDTEEGAYQFPEILPGRKELLFSVVSGDSLEDQSVLVESLETGARKTLIRGGVGAKYAPSGHLVYNQSGTLMAVPLDLASLELVANPVPVVEQIGVSGRGLYFSFSENGVMAYLSPLANPGLRQPQRSGEIGRMELVWVDRRGGTQLLTADRGSYSRPRISTDGNRLATSGARDIVIHDLGRGARTRFHDGTGPLWTPDGDRIAFYNRGAIYWKRLSVTGPAELLVDREYEVFPTDWSPDGRFLAFYEINPSAARDIWMLPLDGDPTPFLATEHDEKAARFSPTGEWVAYVSDESGQYEVYVAPFPRSDERWQVSTGGGTEPVWSPDGRELFYRTGDSLMAASISLGSEVRVGAPKVLFEGRYLHSSNQFNYDVSGDGERFLMVRRVPGSDRINVVLNWFEELKRLVPTD